MKKFLLHTCCAPCSIAIIDELHKKFNPANQSGASLTVFFYNPNIHPVEEYLKRKAEVIKVCKEWGVEMVDMDISPPYQGGVRGGCQNKEIDYDQKNWHKTVKGLEQEPEMGARCPVCFKMRLEKTAKYAKDHGFDIFGTSLTSGRNKKADIIHPIGLSLAKEYDLEFYEEDWKKGGRQELSRKLVHNRGVYLQNYCGCTYSKKN